MKTPTKANVQQGANRAKAYASDTLDAATKKVGEGIDGYPVAALVGGLAIGAAVAALLPRTRQEEQLLGSVGNEINSRAREALGAAKEAGLAKLEELGISTDAAGKQVGKLIDSAAKVAEVAGTAALSSARKH